MFFFQFVYYLILFIQKSASPAQPWLISHFSHLLCLVTVFFFDSMFLSVLMICIEVDFSKKEFTLCFSVADWDQQKQTVFIDVNSGLSFVVLNLASFVLTKSFYFKVLLDPLHSLPLKLILFPTAARQIKNITCRSPRNGRHPSVNADLCCEPRRGGSSECGGRGSPSPAAKEGKS